MEDGGEKDRIQFVADYPKVLFPASSEGYGVFFLPRGNALVFGITEIFIKARKEGKENLERSTRFARQVAPQLGIQS